MYWLNQTPGFPAEWIRTVKCKHPKEGEGKKKKKKVQASSVPLGCLSLWKLRKWDKDVTAHFSLNNVRILRVSVVLGPFKSGNHWSWTEYQFVSRQHDLALVEKVVWNPSVKQTSCWRTTSWYKPTSYMRVDHPSDWRTIWDPSTRCLASLPLPGIVYVTIVLKAVETWRFHIFKCWHTH